MARRKQSGLLDELATLPWPVGVVLGLVAFAFCRHVGGLLDMLGWVLLAGCWAAAFVSAGRSRQRSRLLETQTGLDSLARMHWREFEMLVGEAFRRRGWQVEETGMGRNGGKDGGIDLIVRKDGRTELVQCKHWRERLVRAPVVREMWGLVDHHRADGVNIVCSGDFTVDAAAFARGKAIELINGARLLELVREVQAAKTGFTGAGTERVEPARHAGSADGAALEVTDERGSSPACPACGNGMVRRHNKRTRQAFWGCSGYPACRGTRSD